MAPFLLQNKVQTPSRTIKFYKSCFWLPLRSHRLPRSPAIIFPGTLLPQDLSAGHPRHAHFCMALSHTLFRSHCKHHRIRRIVPHQTSTFPTALPQPSPCFVLSSTSHQLTSVAYLFFVLCPPALEFEFPESRELFHSVHYCITICRTVQLAHSRCSIYIC